jgi:hypothetical protein
MKMKILGMFVCTLLISTILPITETVFAGNEYILLLAITITKNK